MAIYNAVEEFNSGLPCVTNVGVLLMIKLAIIYTMAPFYMMSTNPPENIDNLLVIVVKLNSLVHDLLCFFFSFQRQKRFIALLPSPRSPRLVFIDLKDFHCKANRTGLYLSQSALYYLQ